MSGLAQGVGSRGSGNPQETLAQDIENPQKGQDQATSTGAQDLATQTAGQEAAAHGGEHSSSETVIVQVQEGAKLWQSQRTAASLAGAARLFGIVSQAGTILGASQKTHEDTPEKLSQTRDQLRTQIAISMSRQNPLSCLGFARQLLNLGSIDLSLTQRLQDLDQFEEILGYAEVSLDVELEHRVALLRARLQVYRPEQIQELQQQDELRVQLENGATDLIDLLEASLDHPEVRIWAEELFQRVLSNPQGPWVRYLSAEQLSAYLEDRIKIEQHWQAGEEALDLHESRAQLQAALSIAMKLPDEVLREELFAAVMETYDPEDVAGLRFAWSYHQVLGQATEAEAVQGQLQGAYERWNDSNLAGVTNPSERHEAHLEKADVVIDLLSGASLTSDGILQPWLQNRNLEDDLVAHLQTWREDLEANLEDLPFDERVEVIAAFAQRVVQAKALLGKRVIGEDLQTALDKEVAAAKLMMNLWSETYLKQPEASSTRDRHIAAQVIIDLQIQFHQAILNGDVAWLAELNFDSWSKTAEACELAHLFLDRGMHHQGSSQEKLNLILKSAEMFMAAGQPDRVKSALSLAYSHAETLPPEAAIQTYFVMAQYYQMAGLSDMADHVLDKVIQLETKDSSKPVCDAVNLARGMQALNQGELEEASRYLKTLPANHEAAQAMLKTIAETQKVSRTQQSLQVMTWLVGSKIQSLEAEGEVEKAQALEKDFARCVNEVQTLLQNGSANFVSEALARTEKGMVLEALFLESAGGNFLKTFLRETADSQISDQAFAQSMLKLSRGLIDAGDFGPAQAIAKSLEGDPIAGKAAKQILESLPDEEAFHELVSLARNSSIYFAESDSKAVKSAAFTLATFGAGKLFATLAKVGWVRWMSPAIANPILDRALAWSTGVTAEAVGFTLSGMGMQSAFTGSTENWTWKNFGIETGKMIVTFGLVHGATSSLGGGGRFLAKRAEKAPTMLNKTTATVANSGVTQWAGRVTAFTGADYVNEGIGKYLVEDWYPKEGASFHLRLLHSVVTDAQMMIAGKVVDGISGGRISKWEGEIHRHYENKKALYGIEDLTEEATLLEGEKTVVYGPMDKAGTKVAQTRVFDSMEDGRTEVIQDMTSGAELVADPNRTEVIHDVTNEAELVGDPVEEAPTQVRRRPTAVAEEVPPQAAFQRSARVRPADGVSPASQTYEPAPEMNVAARLGNLPPVIGAPEPVLVKPERVKTDVLSIEEARGSSQAAFEGENIFALIHRAKQAVRNCDDPESQDAVALKAAYVEVEFLRDVFYKEGVTLEKLDAGDIPPNYKARYDKYLESLQRLRDQVESFQDSSTPLIDADGTGRTAGPADLDSAPDKLPSRSAGQSSGPSLPVLTQTRAQFQLAIKEQAGVEFEASIETTGNTSELKGKLTIHKAETLPAVKEALRDAFGDDFKVIGENKAFNISKDGQTVMRVTIKVLKGEVTRKSTPGMSPEQIVAEAAEKEVGLLRAITPNQRELIDESMNTDPYAKTNADGTPSETPAVEGSEAITGESRPSARGPDITLFSNARADFQRALHIRRGAMPKGVSFEAGFQETGDAYHLQGRLEVAHQGQLSTIQASLRKRFGDNVTFNEAENTISVEHEGLTVLVVDVVVAEAEISSIFPANVADITQVGPPPSARGDTQVASAPAQRTNRSEAPTPDLPNPLAQQALRIPKPFELLGQLSARIPNPFELLGRVAPRMSSNPLEVLGLAAPPKEEPAPSAEQPNITGDTQVVSPPQPNITGQTVRSPAPSVEGVSQGEASTPQEIHALNLDEFSGSGQAVEVVLIPEGSPIPEAGIHPRVYIQDAHSQEPQVIASFHEGEGGEWTVKAYGDSLGEPISSQGLEIQGGSQGILRIEGNAFSVFSPGNNRVPMTFLPGKASTPSSEVASLEKPSVKTIANSEPDVVGDVALTDSKTPPPSPDTETRLVTEASQSKMFSPQELQKVDLDAFRGTGQTVEVVFIPEGSPIPEAGIHPRVYIQNAHSKKPQVIATFQEAAEGEWIVKAYGDSVGEPISSRKLAIHGGSKGIIKFEGNSFSLFSSGNNRVPMSFRPAKAASAPAEAPSVESKAKTTPDFAKTSTHPKSWAEEGPLPPPSEDYAAEPAPYVVPGQDRPLATPPPVPIAERALEAIHYSLDWFSTFSLVPDSVANVAEGLRAFLPKPSELRRARQQKAQEELEARVAETRKPQSDPVIVPKQDSSLPPPNIQERALGAIQNGLFWLANSKSVPDSLAKGALDLYADLPQPSKLREARQQKAQAEQEARAAAQEAQEAAAKAKREDIDPRLISDEGTPDNPYDAIGNWLANKMARPGEETPALSEVVDSTSGTESAANETSPDKKAVGHGFMNDPAADTNQIYFSGSEIQELYRLTPDFAYEHEISQTQDGVDQYHVMPEALLRSLDRMLRQSQGQPDNLQLKVWIPRVANALRQQSYNNPDLRGLLVTTLEAYGYSANGLPQSAEAMAGPITMSSTERLAGDRAVLGPDFQSLAVKQSSEVGHIEHLTPELEAAFERGAKVVKVGSHYLLVEPTAGSETSQTRRVDLYDAQAYQQWYQIHGFKEVSLSHARNAWLSLSARAQEFGIQIVYHQPGEGFIIQPSEPQLMAMLQQHGPQVVYLNKLFSTLPDSVLRNAKLKYIGLNSPRKGHDGQWAQYFGNFQTLSLYPGSLGGSRRLLAAVFLHEIGHANAENYVGDRDAMQDYEVIRDNNALLGLDILNGPESRIIEQGRNFEEFFSELHLIYRVAGRQLRNHIRNLPAGSPEKQAWIRMYGRMKELFGGQEYSLITRKMITNDNNSGFRKGNIALPAVPEQGLGEVVAWTDPGEGYSKTNTNEDAVGMVALGEEGRVVVVADGAGGHGDGDKASQAGVETVLDSAIQRPGLSAQHLIELADVGAHDLESSHGIATMVLYKTTVNSLSGERRLSGAIVGDAGLVVFRLNTHGEYEPHYITPGDGIVDAIFHEKDSSEPSIAEQYLDLGISPHQLDVYQRMHPRNNIIFNWIGNKYVPKSSSFEIVLQPGDVVVAGSDGIFETVGPYQMAQRLNQIRLKGKEMSSQNILEDFQQEIQYKVSRYNELVDKSSGHRMFRDPHQAISIPALIPDYRGATRLESVEVVFFEKDLDGHTQYMDRRGTLYAKNPKGQWEPIDHIKPDNQAMTIEVAP